MPTLILPKSKAADSETRTSSVWHIRYSCPFRGRSHVISTFCKNRKNADNALREFTLMLEQGRVGRDNPFQQQRLERHREQVRAEESVTLDAIVGEFAADLQAGRLRKRGRRAPVCEKHAKLVVHHVEAILDGGEIVSIDGLNVGKVNGFLDRCVQDRTIRTAQTRKHYERAIKSFSRWLLTTERVARDPLERLDVTFVDAEQDVVHTRGEFFMTEVNSIVQATIAAPRRATLTGRQRAVLYATAACTGLRARECAAIRKQDCAEDYSIVTLSGSFTKNKKKAVLPIPPGMRPVLAEFATKLTPDEFLWPGGWKKDGDRWIDAGWVKSGRAGKFLRADAALVGIVIGRKGREANGGRVLDFHSFRHTFISNLSRLGLSDGMRRVLSRATAEVTERYTHREASELVAVVDRLPVADLSGLQLPIGEKA